MHLPIPETGNFKGDDLGIPGFMDCPPAPVQREGEVGRTFGEQKNEFDLLDPPGRVQRPAAKPVRDFSHEGILFVRLQREENGARARRWKIAPRKRQVRGER